MISHKHKAIFVHVPKTAGSSIGSFLGEKGFDAVKPLGGANDDVTGAYLNGAAWRIKRNLLDVWGDYFKFAFVRNPWESLVSCWKNRRSARRYDNFSDFIKGYPFNIDSSPFQCSSGHHYTDIRWHTIPQFTHISDEAQNVLVDFIGRFENLQEDFNVVCDKIGIPRQELPHKNKSKNKHYTEYYDDDAAIELVAKKYAKDIEMFGYEFGGQ